jgi:Tfp pilus assembly protein PilN
MRRLRIDFLRSPGAPSATGIAFLLVGALSSTMSVSWYVSVLGEVEQLETSVSEMKRMSRRVPGRMTESPRDARETQQEIRIANQVVQQMTLPWDRLFRELETAATKEVALLAVQPDVSSRQVRISGEAKSFKAMLDYSRRLEQTDMLGEVVLLGHEVRSQDPQRPVAFSLSAGWSDRP